MKEKTEKRGVSRLVAIVICLLFGVFGYFLLMASFLIDVTDLEHYLRVYKNPLEVTAVVSYHDSDHDDDGEHYVSYLSYEAEGAKYTDIQYESEDEKSSLTPVGEEITIQVSPEDPAQLVSKLRHGSDSLLFSALPVLLMHAYLYKYFRRRGLTKGRKGTPDNETIQKDLKIMILSRMLRLFFLFSFLAFAFFHWRYSVVFDKALTIAAVCLCLWLYRCYVDFRDYRNADHGEFEIHRDVLAYKREERDSDGDPTYRLYYKSGDREWADCVTWKVYDRAREGDVVVAVYLPGRKRPILHYNVDGDADD